MTRQLDVLNGIKALIETALQAHDPDRRVIGLENAGAPPDRVPPEGRFVLRRGDPGDPQVDLNPPTYNYEHQIPLQISTMPDDDRGMTAAEVADEILGQIADAIVADRTVGGLVDWLDASAPPLIDRFVAGGPPGCELEAVLVATYASTSPL